MPQTYYWAMCFPSARVMSALNVHPIWKISSEKYQFLQQEHKRSLTFSLSQQRTVVFSSSSLPCHHWWCVECIPICTTSEMKNIFTCLNMSQWGARTSVQMSLSQVIRCWRAVGCTPTSAVRARTRPAARISVPRAWTQSGRHSQWESKSRWYPYSHSGRPCSPLTTHVPRGVRNPDSIKHTAQINKLPESVSSLDLCR